MFIPARWFHHGRLGGVDVLVLHTAEGARSAMQLGHYFNASPVQASSHSGVDDLGRVDYVHFDDTAWAAPGANADGEHLELCGFAHWTREEWTRDHAGMLAQAESWLIERCHARNIPPRILTPADLRADQRGITTHHYVSQAFRLSDHVDPDNGHAPWTGFPLDLVVEAVRARLAVHAAPAGVPHPASTKAYPPWPGRVLQADYRGGAWRVGTTGRDVMAWQRRMRQRGWRAIGRIDGAFGVNCRAAAEQFQREKGLHVDGEVGHDTWRATWASPIT